MKRIHLVRHAKAGDRSSWAGDDRERPLSKAGERQARALAEQLAAASPTELVSSPSKRCHDTLKPLAKALGTKVRDDDRLGEGASFTDVIELLDALPDGSVLCSHGDVIPEVIAALQRRGCTITTAPDWRKATVWTISVDDDGVCRASVSPPPAV